MDFLYREPDLLSVVLRWNEKGFRCLNDYQGLIRSAAQVHDERFKACVALQAQHVYDTFGKFPGTVPSMFLIMYLQAHHLDLDFYDEFYKPGSYLQTHADHMKRWHAK